MSDPIATSYIASLAFELMHLRPLSSFGEDTELATTARRNLSVARDLVLAQHDWSRARSVIVLPLYTGGGVVTDDELPYIFAKTPDILVLRHVYSDMPWREDGDYIRSAQSTALKVRATVSVAREKRLSAELQVAIAHQLAVLMMGKNVGSRTKKEDLKTDLYRAIDAAKAADRQSASVQDFNTGQGIAVGPDWVSEVTR